MKPSERIKEIHAEYMKGENNEIYVTELFQESILDYLDEEWEKKQFRDEDGIIIEGL